MHYSSTRLIFRDKKFDHVISSPRSHSPRGRQSTQNLRKLQLQCGFLSLIRVGVACEQAHLYQEPAKRGKVWVKRGKVTLPRPILLASSRSKLPVLTSEPARRLGLEHMMD